MNHYAMLHPTMQCKLAGAMRRTIRLQHPIYVLNRQGCPILRVEHKKLSVKLTGRSSGFVVYAGGLDVTGEFYKAMRV